MDYYKYKFKVVGEFGDPSRVTHSLNMPHNMRDESTLVVKDYVSKERESEYSVCSASGSAEQISEFVSSQSEHIGLTKITKSEFEPLMQASFTYERQQEILNELKKEKCKELKAKLENALEDSELNVANVGVVNGGRKHKQNVEVLINQIDNLGGSVKFRAYDNSYITLNKAQLNQIIDAMEKQALSEYNKYWSLCENINKAQNVEAIYQVLNG